MSDLDTFWKNFIQENWEKNPLQLDESPLQLEVPDETVFEAMVAAAAYRGRILPRPQVNINRRPQVVDAAQYLPNDADQSLDGYLSRVDQALADDEWAVTFTGLHGLSSALWDRAKEVADRVHALTGNRLAGRVDVDAFLGRYGATNVGVHVDHACNFTFVLRGVKTLLTWPPSDSDRVPQLTQDYASARPFAKALIGRPGGLTYFPSPQLHVGESPDAVSVMVNIAFFTTADPAASMLETVEKVLSGFGPVESTIPVADAPDLPPGYEKMLADLGDAARSGRLADAAWETWMRRVTSGGLDVGRPTMIPALFPDEARIRLSPGVVLRHRRLGDGRLGIAAQGHTLRVPYDSSVLDLVNVLISGATVDLNAWTNEQTEATGRLGQAMLIHLGTWAAIEVPAA